MRERESMLQQFGEFLLKARLVKGNAAPHCVGWSGDSSTLRPAKGRSPIGHDDSAKSLERRGVADWQVRQAEQAILSKREGPSGSENERHANRNTVLCFHRPG